MSISSIIRNLYGNFANFHRLNANVLGKSSLCANPFFYIYFFFGERRGGGGVIFRGVPGHIFGNFTK